MPSGVYSSTWLGCVSSPQLKLRPVAAIGLWCSVAQSVLPLSVVQTCHSVCTSVGWHESALPWAYQYRKALVSANSLLENWLLGCVSAFIQRGSLHVEERMVKATSGDARCEITYQETKNMTDEAKMHVWYVFTSERKFQWNAPIVSALLGIWILAQDYN